MGGVIERGLGQPLRQPARSDKVREGGGGSTAGSGLTEGLTHLDERPRLPALHGVHRRPQHACGLLEGESVEKSKGDDLGVPMVERGDGVGKVNECGVERRVGLSRVERFEGQRRRPAHQLPAMGVDDVAGDAKEPGTRGKALIGEGVCMLPRLSEGLAGRIFGFRGTLQAGGGVAVDGGHLPFEQRAPCGRVTSPEQFWLGGPDYPARWFNSSRRQGRDEDRTQAPSASPSPRQPRGEGSHRAAFRSSLFGVPVAVTEAVGEGLP